MGKDGVEARPVVLPTGGRRTRRVRGWLVMLLVVALAAFGAGWAVREVLYPASDVSASETQTTVVEVTEGTVSQSLNLNVSVSWPSSSQGVNEAVGTVTSVEIPAGEHVSAGDALFSVDLRPVVVAEGTVPSFRTLQEGDTGDDVKQLQQLLTTLGLYSGKASGDFDWVVTAAVEDWQTRLGVDADGVVQAGDILYLPSLPARVTLDTDTVKVGARLAGGEQVVNTLGSAPKFVLNVTTAQASRVTEGTEVQITSPDGDTWTALAGEQTVQDDGTTVSIALSGEGDSTICGDGCNQISVSGSTVLDSTVVTVAETAGLIVPDAALTTSASGTVEVVSADGTHYPVTVSASANGMSVISGDGVQAGLDVQVPAS